MLSWIVGFLFPQLDGGSKAARTTSGVHGATLEPYLEQMFGNVYWGAAGVVLGMRYLKPAQPDHEVSQGTPYRFSEPGPGAGAFVVGNTHSPASVFKDKPCRKADCLCSAAHIFELWKYARHCQVSTEKAVRYCLLSVIVQQQTQTKTKRKIKHQPRQ